MSSKVETSVRKDRGNASGISHAESIPASRLIAPQAPSEITRWFENDKNWHALMRAVCAIGHQPRHFVNLGRNKIIAKHCDRNGHFHGGYVSAEFEDVSVSLPVPADCGMEIVFHDALRLEKMIDDGKFESMKRHHVDVYVRLDGYGLGMCCMKDVAGHNLVADSKSRYVKLSWSEAGDVTVEIAPDVLAWLKYIASDSEDVAKPIGSLLSKEDLPKSLINSVRSLIEIQSDEFDYDQVSGGDSSTADVTFGEAFIDDIINDDEDHYLDPEDVPWLDPDGSIRLGV